MSLAQALRQRSAELWHVQRIKRLVRDRFDLGPHALIRVEQMPCKDGLCPGPVTQITVLSVALTRRSFALHRPLAAITAAELAELDFLDS
ncbi:MAG: hypothetical protein EA339_04345 [Rhodobacteraceae bacterium]|nr:MAG: hypothetical protein EA339_04345 [Paracoccaceae bacterium]